MNYLTVFYDGKCDFCCACRQWLSLQPKFLDLRFIAFQSDEAKVIMPTLATFQPDRQLVVLSDQGGVYVGDEAWIMCLYALVDFREWAQRLSSPALRPLAKRLCKLVSQNRLTLSKLCWARDLERLQASS